MAFPSSIDAPGGTAAQGTSLLSSIDHALDHRTLGSAIIAIENKVGIGAGSAALNQIPVGSGAGTSAWGSVWNNASLGTPAITGGTINSATFGTPSVIGGTIGTAVVIGGTVNATNLVTTGGSVNISAAATPTTNQILTATSGTTATWQSAQNGTVVQQAITTNSTLSPYVLKTGWTYIQGDGANASVIKTITFNAGFTTTPIITISLIGYKTSSAPTVLSDFNVFQPSNVRPATVMIGTIGTAAFTAQISTGNSPGTLNTDYYGISWTAIGS